MPTNLALDDKLINQAVTIGHHKSKKDAVNTALTEYINRHSQASIIDMFGKVEYFADYNYKKLRSRKPR